jgi:hypothetical protein
VTHSTARSVRARSAPSLAQCGATRTADPAQQDGPGSAGPGAP